MRSHGETGKQEFETMNSLSTVQPDEEESTKRVGIVLLNYNGSRFLRKLLWSLTGQTFNDFELIFVDNASTDDSLQTLREVIAEIPIKFSVKLVENKTNLGYCAGNNLGLKHTDAMYVVFLNNDTIVAERWLEEMVRIMEDHPQIGACQSRLVYPKGDKVQADGWLMDRYGWSKELILHQTNTDFSTAPFYVSGTSMILRRTAVDEVNGFDSRLFYGDSDICWRLRLIGYDMGSAPTSVCYHYGSVATRSLISRLSLIQGKNFEILRMLLKNYSVSEVVKTIPVSLFIMILEATVFSLRFKNAAYLTSPLNAVWKNLKSLGNILLSRYMIQNLRKISDKEIEMKMLRQPVAISRRLTGK